MAYLFFPEYRGVSRNILRETLTQSSRQISPGLRYLQVRTQCHFEDRKRRLRKTEPERKKDYDVTRQQVRIHRGILSARGEHFAAPAVDAKSSLLSLIRFCIPSPGRNHRQLKKKIKS